MLSDACLQNRFPEYDIPSGIPGTPEKMLDVSKAMNELGIQFFPVRTTFVDMAVTLLDLGIATPKLK